MNFTKLNRVRKFPGSQYTKKSNEMFPFQSLMKTAAPIKMKSMTPEVIEHSCHQRTFLGLNTAVISEHFLVPTQLSPVNFS